MTQKKPGRYAGSMLDWLKDKNGGVVAVVGSLIILLGGNIVLRLPYVTVPEAIQSHSAADHQDEFRRIVEKLETNRIWQVHYQREIEWRKKIKSEAGSEWTQADQDRLEQDQGDLQLVEAARDILMRQLSRWKAKHDPLAIEKNQE
jgi:hypothetical protein